MTNDEKAQKYDELVYFIDMYRDETPLSSYTAYERLVDGIDKVIGDPMAVHASPGDIPHAPDKGPFNVCQDPGVPGQPETVDP